MLRSDGDIKWIPVRSAAKMLRVSRQRVHQLIEAGGLVGIMQDRTMLVSLRSVEARIALLVVEGGNGNACR
jgi:hypothetical protein